MGANLYYSMLKLLILPICILYLYLKKVTQIRTFKTRILDRYIPLIFEANSNFRLSISFFLLKWNENFQSRHHYVGTSTLWQMHFLRDSINSYAYGIHPNTVKTRFWNTTWSAVKVFQNRVSILWSKTRTSEI